MSLRRNSRWRTHLDFLDWLACFGRTVNLDGVVGSLTWTGGSQNARTYCQRGPHRGSFTPHCNPAPDGAIAREHRSIAAADEAHADVSVFLVNQGSGLFHVHRREVVNV